MYSHQGPWWKQIPYRSASGGQEADGLAYVFLPGLASLMEAPPTLMPPTDEPLQTCRETQ